MLKKRNLEKRIANSMKRIRDLPLFYVTDVMKEGYDFTKATRFAILAMKSVPCILDDAIVRQINLARYGVYEFNEKPIVPGSIFHSVSDQHRDGLVEGQVKKNSTISRRKWPILKQCTKNSRELKQKFANSVSYHWHLACSQCSQDITAQFSIRQEVTDSNLSHCQAGI